MRGVCVVDAGDSERARAAANELGVDVQASSTLSCVNCTCWCVRATFDGLELRDGGVQGEVRIGAALPRRPRLTRQDPLIKAVGIHNRSVVDVTAGIGTDALTLLWMDYQLVAIEVVDLVRVLLKDRLSRAGRRGKATPVHGGDAAALLPGLDTPDVVFMDPMFPGRRRSSALARKELVTLAELTPDVDPQETAACALLEAARKVASNRVVVKRLPESATLGGEPSHSIKSRTVRYDVYLS